MARLSAALCGLFTPVTPGDIVGKFSREDTPALEGVKFSEYAVGCNLAGTVRPARKSPSDTRYDIKSTLQAALGVTRNSATLRRALTMPPKKTPTKVQARTRTRRNVRGSGVRSDSPFFRSPHHRCTSPERRDRRKPLTTRRTSTLPATNHTHKPKSPVRRPLPPMVSAANSLETQQKQSQMTPLKVHWRKAGEGEMPNVQNGPSDDIGQQDQRDSDGEEKPFLNQEALEATIRKKRLALMTETFRKLKYVTNYSKLRAHGKRRALFTIIKNSLSDSVEVFFGAQFHL